MHSLSVPTWIIHVSSVLEWTMAIWLLWIRAKTSPLATAKALKGLSLAMIPALVSAMCACTWHFFDNSITLEWLVTLQAAMTLIGNCCLMIAGYFLYKIRNLSTF